jgi:hypothetical protein
VRENGELFRESLLVFGSALVGTDGLGEKPVSFHLWLEAVRGSWLAPIPIRGEASPGSFLLQSKYTLLQVCKTTKADIPAHGKKLFLFFSFAGKYSSIT